LERWFFCILHPHTSHTDIGVKHGWLRKDKVAATELHARTLNVVIWSDVLPKRVA
jgi:hypothetical protein